MPYAQDLTLFYSPYCGFCVYVLKAMQAMDVEMNMRNVNEERGHRRELIQGGGRGMVPCLRITEPDGSERWMYESRDIVRYLTDRFSESPPAHENAGQSARSR